MLPTEEKDAEYWAEFRKAKMAERRIPEHGKHVPYQSPPGKLNVVSKVFDYTGERSVLENQVLKDGNQLNVELPNGKRKIILVKLATRKYKIQDMNATIRISDSYAFFYSKVDGVTVEVPLEGLKAWFIE